MTQEEALKILKTGANVFLTGQPGSGKTYTLSKYIDYLNDYGIRPAITASTGIASTHIGGVTLHSWSGIGIKDNITPRDLDALSQNEKFLKRIKNTKVLIIDEISMLSGNVLGMVDKVCREFLESSRPFGGLQVVVSGDFFQLPPVMPRIKNERINESEFFDLSDSVPQSAFAFDSPSWREAQFTVLYLDSQYRQEDEQLLNVLAGLRAGEVSEVIIECLQGRCQIPGNEKVLPKLYTHNANVDLINNKEIEKISGPSKTFEMVTKGSRPLVEGLIKNCLSPEILTLKVGAKVMFTKNSADGSFVNGTLGEVSGFSNSGKPIVKLKSGKKLEVEPAEWRIENDGKILATVAQLPLRLAWAITVHKSQGMSLDSASMDLSSCFEYGQGYVALSRVRSLSGLYLDGFNQRSLMVHPRVIEVDDNFKKSSTEAGSAFGKITGEKIKEMFDSFILFCGGSKEKGKELSEKVEKVSTYDKTKELLLKKKSIKEIAKERDMTEGTIIGHIEKLVEEEKIKPKEISYLRPNGLLLEKIERAFLDVHKKTGEMKLGPVKAKVGESASFDELRLVRVFLDN